ncbi:MAG TPA: hypothetical protein VHL58_03565, partial [Thermoanaerobaculia bacterium]|nr:hypothetical protein [Thermoanaerobaculia bacterium]
MRPALFLILLLASAAASSAEPTFTIYGFLSARGEVVRSQPSWLQQGFGRLDEGADAANRTSTPHSEALQLGIDVQPARPLNFHLHLIARDETTRHSGSSAGLVEAYGDLRPLDDGINRVRLRAGMFFLPTSRENVGELWSSPYTLTLSTLNSWVAQELRPIGGEVEYRRETAERGSLAVAASLFGGNDSSGTALAWRGWAMSSRLSTLGEVLPLPRLFSLRNSTLFGMQRSDGTRAFGHDRDGRVGWTGRARWEVPGNGTLQIAAVDNRGDRALHHGEYSWRTRFWLLSADLHPTEHTTLAAEFLSGKTGMGFPPGANVRMQFRTGYALVSQQFGRNRISLRLERFKSVDRDHSAAESNDDSGHAVTLAWFYDAT